MLAPHRKAILLLWVITIAPHLPPTYSQRGVDRSRQRTVEENTIRKIYDAFEAHHRTSGCGNKAQTRVRTVYVKLPCFQAPTTTTTATPTATKTEAPRLDEQHPLFSGHEASE